MSGKIVENRALSFGSLLTVINKYIPCCRGLFSYRSQMTSKYGKNKKVTHVALAECVTDVLLPNRLQQHEHENDLLVNRRTATWNLFVLYNNESFLFQNLLK